jgi:hypothetical protein
VVSQLDSWEFSVPRQASRMFCAAQVDVEDAPAVPVAVWAAAVAARRTREAR